MRLSTFAVLATLAGSSFAGLVDGVTTTSKTTTTTSKTTTTTSKTTTTTTTTTTTKPSTTTTTTKPSTTTTTTTPSTTTTTTTPSTTTTSTKPSTTTTTTTTTPSTTTTTTTPSTTTTTTKPSTTTTTTTTTPSTTTTTTTPSTTTTTTTSNALTTSSDICSLGSTATVTVYVTGSPSSLSSSSAYASNSSSIASTSSSVNLASTSASSSSASNSGSVSASTSAASSSSSANVSSSSASISSSASVSNPSSSSFLNSTSTAVNSSITSVSSTILSSTAKSASSTSSSASASASATGNTVTGTILIIAADDSTASQAYLGLNGYGIPYQVLTVPSTGTTLPALNSSSGGNFGGIIIINELSYDYSTGYASALTTAQWNALYAYQIAYGVRMVQWGVYPDTGDYGAEVVSSSGCCNSGVEQYVMFSDTTAFPQAGLRSWANMSTSSIFHYPATITDPSTTTEIAQFKASSDGSFPSSNYTAAVINNFSGREQMVFFMDWNLSWSTTCTIMQHAWITWMTRGLYAGYRRVQFNTQIDDMFLLTNIYYPGSGTTTYRVSTDDMNTITNWIPTVEAKMNSGSDYRVEVGFNGNGNIQTATNYATSNMALCDGGAIYTTTEATTALEFVKPLGSGVNYWPSSPASFGYNSSCAQQDSLEVWWTTSANRANYYTISHTFTHLNLDNSTYADTYKEITWNQDWFAMASMNDAGFTSNGLIPPAITGLHNGDALRAWSDAGLSNCVGDNSRSVLRNADNNMYTYTTTVDNDGFDGISVIGRWPTRIYYDCDTDACTVAEWAAVEGVSGSFSDLMEDEVDDTMQYLFGLIHDPYMFHQLNLRNTGIASPNTTPDGTQVYSLFQTWVETMVYNFVRLCDWPMITYQQSEMAVKYAEREARDACDYQYQWIYGNSSITGVTVSCTGNTCSEPIPLTVPGSVTNTQGFTTEQIGNDPLTIWVQLTGQPVTFTLSSPVSL